MPKSFEVRTQQVSGTLNLKLMGHLDGSSASEIAVYLDRATGHYERFIIDASGIKRLHPFGMVVLDKALTRLRRSGKDLRLTVMIAPAFKYMPTPNIPQTGGARRPLEPFLSCRIRQPASYAAGWRYSQKM